MKRAEELYKRRIKARDDAAQVFCWCVVIALHQEEGIGAERLERACLEMKQFEDGFQTKVLASGRKKATDEMERILDGVYSTDITLPRLRYPKNRAEEQIRMAENEGGQIAWLVMACAVRSSFKFGPSRLERLKKASLDNYRQYVQWKEEDGEYYALEQIRRCASQAIRENLTIADTPKDDEKKSMPVQETDPAVRMAVASAVASGIAKKKGVKNVPLLVLSDNAVKQRIDHALSGIPYMKR